MKKALFGVYLLIGTTITLLVLAIPSAQANRISTAHGSPRRLQPQASPISLSTLRAQAALLGLHIGTAVGIPHLSSDAVYAQMLGQQFSAITPENEMKWDAIEPQQGVFTFGSADAEVQFAQQHQQLVRGHNLVWYRQLPTWLTNGSFTHEQLADLLKQHIFTEVGHFAGKVWQWDVVNEPLNEDGTLSPTIWEQALGPNYIADVFRWAHQADPQARLFLNEYDTETIGKKSDGLYELVKSLKGQGVPIDGIGFETHLSLQANLSGLQANLQRFVNLGLQVAITEMDVRTPLPFTPDDLSIQADLYAQAMQACLAVRGCVDFSVWGFTDKYSWIPGFFSGQGAADIYDASFTPKPAYDALVEALVYPLLNAGEKVQ